jgi:hypothetical protein
MTQDELVIECKKVITEGRIFAKIRSIVGLFSQFDDLVMERLVGTANFKAYLTTEARDSFTI